MIGNPLFWSFIPIYPDMLYVKEPVVEVLTHKIAKKIKKSLTDKD